MNGRIYRLRRRNAVNLFGPADYESLGSHISNVKQYQVAKTVEVTTDDTTINPYLKEILVFNKIKPGQVKITNKKIKFYIPSMEERFSALDIFSRIVGDSISDVDFSGSTPKAVSAHGVNVPLVGYTKEMAESGDKGKVSIGTNSGSSAGEVAPSGEEKSSPNWILIAGIAVVGVIALLAVIKMLKK